MYDVRGPGFLFWMELCKLYSWSCLIKKSTAKLSIKGLAGVPQQVSRRERYVQHHK